MNMRDRVLSARPAPSERVAIGETWVDVRQMLVWQYERYEGWLVKRKETGSSTPSIRALLLVSTVHDPETGEPVFTEDDVQTIDRLPSRITDAAFQVAVRLNFRDLPAAPGDAAKNS